MSPPRCDSRSLEAWTDMTSTGERRPEFRDGAVEHRHDAIDLRARDHERRREHDGAAQMTAPAGAADDHPVAAGVVHHTLDAVGRQGLLRAPALHQLDAGEQPLASYVAHPRMPAERAQPLEEISAIFG